MLVDESKEANRFDKKLHSLEHLRFGSPKDLRPGVSSAAKAECALGRVQEKGPSIIASLRPWIGASVAGHELHRTRH